MKKSIHIFIILLLLSGCKNHYNEMIEWTDNIEIGTDIQTIKSTQPAFLEISWNNPRKFENEIYYEISKIDGNNDILNMQNFLVFENGKYQGRQSIK